MFYQRLLSLFLSRFPTCSVKGIFESLCRREEEGNSIDRNGGYVLKDSEDGNCVRYSQLLFVVLNQ